MHSARLLDGRLRTARILEVYTQEKRRLSIVCQRGTSITTIILSCVPAENALIVTDGNTRARHNAADLFPEFVGAEVSRIACDGLDRILSLEFADGREVRCEFFGVRANILAYAADHSMIDCFLHKEALLEEHPAATLRLQWHALTPLLHPSEAQRITGTRDAFTQTFQHSGKATALAALKASIPKLGAELAEELLWRCRIDPEASAAHVAASENLQRLYDSSLQSVSDLLDYTTAPESRIYWDDARAVCFSLSRLESKSAYREELVRDLFEGVRRFVSASKARASFGAQKETLQSWLEHELARTERTLERMQQDQTRHDRAADYERFGMLLMANLGRIDKGMETIRLEDFSDPAVRHQIALDPSLSAVQNAERYFQKSKHAKSAALEARQRRSWLETHADALRPLLKECQAAQTRDAMKSLIAAHGPLLKQLGYMTDTEREQLPPFRIFTVEGGFQVLAGKSSDNNDLLTTKYARPNDLWFHARGSSGSHVVLKVASASGEPTKKAIHQAASIAAYYSKMKNASAVPVAMTEKKFVHKPKGVPAGTVTLDREKVIFVEPKLPDTGQLI
ncbi:MAG TPA: NFACT RNA binding domain-containing protein [Bacteroidota bacterium]|nr:NFACT RNA binding domain-containing protein [Bacteroidota bacterium]